MTTGALGIIEWIEGEMTDNLPPCALEFKPRWPNDPGGYTADQMQAYALAAIEKDRERQSVTAAQDAANLLARYERQWHRMGELWERRQGLRWLDKESAEFAQLRDERAPATRAALLAFLAAPQPQPAQQEPVAKYIGESPDGSLVQLYDDLRKGTDLYTSPQTQPQPVQQDHYKELATLGWQAIECPVCGSSAQAYPRQAPQPQPSPISVLRAVEKSIKNEECPWHIEQAFDEYEAQRQSATTKGTT